MGQLIRRNISNWFFWILDTDIVPNQIKILLVNFAQIILRKRTRFTFVQENGLWKAKEEEGADSLAYRFGSDLRRLYQLNMFGIRERSERLAASYFLTEISFKPGDTIVDVGANWGDLYGFFVSKGINPKYFAFEPNPNDFVALRLNVASQFLFQLAVGDRGKSLPLFLNSKEGDSSLIEPATGSTGSVQVKVVSLDEFFSHFPDLGPVKLLKIEAEGFEPEILSGSANILGNVEFCAVDGGPERGVRAETTIEPLLNFLIPLGFRIVKLDVESGMGRALLVRAKVD